MVTDWYHKTSARPTKAAIRRGSTRSTWATTTTATHSRPTCPNRSTWRRSCSASGFRRPTSITTTWAQRRAHLPAAVRRTGAAVRRSAGVARDELVRRPHGLQGRREPSPASSTPRFTPAGATSAFTGSRPSTTSPACSPNRRARGSPRRSSSTPISCAAARATPRIRRADDVPESLARRLVASARHRRTAEDFGLGDARSRRAQPRDRALERLSEGEAADRARRGGHQPYASSCRPRSTIRSPP